MRAFLVSTWWAVLPFLVSSNEPTHAPLSLTWATGLQLISMLMALVSPPSRRATSRMPFLKAWLACGFLTAARGSARGAEALEQQQTDERLGVADGVDRAGEVAQRPADDLDALVLAGVVSPTASVSARGEEEMDDLVGEADRGAVGLRACSQRAACMPISSASSRWADSSGVSPSWSRRPAGISRLSGSSTASRGWRTSQTCSSSIATIAAAPRGADDLAVGGLAVGVAVGVVGDRDDPAGEDGSRWPMRSKVAVVVALMAARYPRRSSSSA